MPETLKFLAFDLGAESGRGVVGLFDGDRLRLEDVHRFPNGPVRVLDSIHWDVLRLWSEMKEALGLCVKAHGPELEGVGVDTWGVDFGLLGRDDQLLGDPFHYRDKRTDGMMDRAFAIVPREEIFRQTGIQFMPLNTLFQLFAMAQGDSPALQAATTLLMMPDLLNFWLTGRKVCEFSIATTSQCYDPTARAWANDLLGRLGIRSDILADIVSPGTVLGEMLPSVADETGVRSATVIAPACHDTAAAVAAVPAKGMGHCYLSSGTWSLMGVEVREPIINDQSLAYNFTNEGGVCDTFRFLKNIMGLWLVQECRRTWEREGDALGYDELTRLAADAQPFAALVEPDDRAFLAPGDMPAEIRAFCQRTGQPVPEDKGAIVRCALESLALKYRWVLEKLEEIAGQPLWTLHMVGGGTQNRLLCQFAANATQRPAYAGPVEATAIGNVMMQALARGHVASIEEAREVIRNSFELVSYEPQEKDAWDDAYGRFLDVMSKAEAAI